LKKETLSFNENDCLMNSKASDEVKVGSIFEKWKASEHNKQEIDEEKHFTLNNSVITAQPSKYSFILFVYYF
jgi:hypothetical protein